MLARLRSAAVCGVDAYPVDIEVDVSFGLPHFTMVGLPDATSAFLFTVMPVRAGRTLTTTVTTSNTDVGLLVTEADGAGQSRQVTIEENTYITAGTVDTGGVAFDRRKVPDRRNEPRSTPDRRRAPNQEYRLHRPQPS